MRPCLPTETNQRGERREKTPYRIHRAPEKTEQGETVFDRITFDARILGGRASIRGMRIGVAVIVGQLAHGASWDEVLSDYPDLEAEDIRQALSYAAWLAQEEVVTV